MVSKHNIAATLGGWSVRHRKAAILGWLIFVIVVAVLGSAAGQSSLQDYQQLAGGSGQAEKILAQAKIGDPAVELVLVHSPLASATASRPFSMRKWRRS